MENTNMSKSKVSVILKSLVISYIATGLLLLLLTVLLFKMELDESKVSIGIIGIYLISCFVGGFLAGKKCKNKKFLWGLLVGISYFLLLIVMSLIANQTLQSQPLQLMTTFLLCAGGGMLGGMFS